MYISTVLGPAGLLAFSAAALPIAQTDDMVAGPKGVSKSWEAPVANYDGIFSRGRRVVETRDEEEPAVDVLVPYDWVEAPPNIIKRSIDTRQDPSDEPDLHVEILGTLDPDLGGSPANQYPKRSVTKRDPYIIEGPGGPVRPSCGPLPVEPLPVHGPEPMARDIACPMLDKRQDDGPQISEPINDDSEKWDLWPGFIPRSLRPAKRQDASSEVAAPINEGAEKRDLWANFIPRSLRSEKRQDDGLEVAAPINEDSEKWDLWPNFIPRSLHATKRQDEGSDTSGIVIDKASWDLSSWWR